MLIRCPMIFLMVVLAGQVVGISSAPGHPRQLFSISSSRIPAEPWLFASISVCWSSSCTCVSWRTPSCTRGRCQWAVRSKHIRIEPRRSMASYRTCFLLNKSCLVSPGNDGCWYWCLSPELLVGLKWWSSSEGGKLFVQCGCGGKMTDSGKQLQHFALSNSMSLMTCLQCLWKEGCKFRARNSEQRCLLTWRSGTSMDVFTVSCELVGCHNMFPIRGFGMYKKL